MWCWLGSRRERLWQGLNFEILSGLLRVLGVLRGEFLRVVFTADTEDSQEELKRQNSFLCCVLAPVYLHVRP